ncbi:hypothetical protein VUR80DRAFT_5446 [Thermomyces stellatus]
MSEAVKPVGFLGLGAMGFGMATHLVKSGYQVTGFDVWGPTLERFKQAGGIAAMTPAGAVEGKDLAVCMVATAQQAQDALLDGPNPAAPALSRGAALLLCSTVSCGYVRGLAKQLEDMGRSDIQLIDCPVSGGAIRAADGTLSIMAGAASPEAIEKARELLQTMSSPEGLYIVRGVGAGSNMKMCHQVLASVHILAASEAMGFVDHLGLDLPTAGKALVESDGGSWMLGNRLPRILHPQFQPVASAVTIILKDTNIITSEARNCGFATLMVSTAEQGYVMGVGRGFGPDDDASLLRLYNEGKGKVGPVKGAAESDAEKLRLATNLLKGIHLCSAAECLAFSHRVGLDLDQVLELCVNAAGGSAILKRFGADIIRVLRGEELAGGGLRDVVEDLREAVEEAHRLKVPLLLGTQALLVLRLALKHTAARAADASPAMAVKVWATD